MALSSTSDFLRKRGNKCFLRADDPSIVPVIRKMRLTEASKLYRQALFQAEQARDCSGQASCWKNISVTEWKLLQHTLQFSDVNTDYNILKHSLTEALVALRQAATFGNEGKSDGWMETLDSLFETNIYSVLAFFYDFDSQIRKKCLLLLSDSVSSKIHSLYDCESVVLKCKNLVKNMVHVHLRCAEFFFHSGIRSLDSGGGGTESSECSKSYISCLNFMRESYTPLIRAEEAGNKDPEQLELVKELSDQVFQYECTCEALQSLTVGKNMLENALTENVELNMTQVEAAIDKFKESIILTRGIDVESEGIAHSELGEVYGKVLKKDRPAHRYHSIAVQFGIKLQEIVPRIRQSKWFQKSLTEVERYQKEVLKEEEEARAKEREPLLKSLKNELAALNREATNGTESFLRFLYPTHPPKNSRHQLGSLSAPDVVKKTIMLAISHYHPDKNMTHDPKWQVLCEEITKILNKMYEYYKVPSHD